MSRCLPGEHARALDEAQAALNGHSADTLDETGSLLVPTFRMNDTDQLSARNSRQATRILVAVREFGQTQHGDIKKLADLRGVGGRGEQLALVWCCAATPCW